MQSNTIIKRGNIIGWVYQNPKKIMPHFRPRFAPTSAKADREKGSSISVPLFRELRDLAPLSSPTLVPISRSHPYYYCLHPLEYLSYYFLLWVTHMEFSPWFNNYLLYQVGSAAGVVIEVIFTTSFIFFFIIKYSFLFYSKKWAVILFRCYTSSITWLSQRASRLRCLDSYLADKII